MDTTQELLSPAHAAVHAANAVAERVLNTTQRWANNAVNQAETVARNVANTFATVGRSAQMLGTTILGSAIDQVGRIFTHARSHILALGGSLLSGLLQARGAIANSVLGFAGRVLGLLFTGGSFALNIGRTVLANITGLIGGAIGTAGFLGNAGGRNIAGTVLGMVLGTFSVIGMLVDRAVRGAAGIITGLVFGLVATIGSIVRTLTTALVNAIASAVQSLVETMINGIVSAGRTLVTTLLESIGALGPIGLAVLVAVGAVALGVASRIVSAVSALLTTVATFVWNAVATVATFAGSLLARAWVMAGNAFTVVWGGIQRAFTTFGSILRSVIGTLSSWASTAWSWVSALARRAWTWVSSQIAPLVGAISSLVGTIGTFAISLAKVLALGAVFGLFAKAVYEAAKSAIDFAQNAKLFSAQTGLSLGTSAGIANRFGVQGIGQDALGSALGNQNPFIFGLKARAFGLPGYNSPDFMESLAKRFQGLNTQGPIGNVIAQSMMRTLGLNSPEFLKLTNTSPATIRANAAYGRQIDSNLGLTPGALSKYANEIPALVGRIGYGFEKLKLVLAGTALPMVEGLLNAFTKTFGENAGRIRGFIENACKFMFSAAPIILASSVALVAKMVANGVHNLLNWATWVVTELPKVLETGAQSVANTLRRWGASIGDFTVHMTDLITTGMVNLGNFVSQWIRTISGYIVTGMMSVANFLQSMWTGSGQQNPLRNAARWVAGAFDTMANAARDFVGRFAQFTEGLKNVVAGLSPIVAGLMGIDVLHMKTPQQAYDDAVKNMPKSNTLRSVDRFFAGPTLPRMAAGLANSANTFQQNANTAANNVTSNMGNLAYNTRIAGYAAAARLHNGLLSAGNSIASPDGQYNIGRNIGNTLSERAKPVMDALSKVAPAVDSFSNAAQAYKDRLGTEKERGDRWDELIAATNRVSQTIREEARRNMGNGHLGDGLDALTSHMLLEFTNQQTRATRSFGG